MTKFYKVEPVWKKSITEYTGYSDKDKKQSFETEEMYRWGYVVVKVEDDWKLEDVFGDINDDNNEYECEDWEDINLDDQCSFYFNNVKGLDSEKLDEDYEEQGWDLIEPFGDPDYCYVSIQGKMKLTDVSDQYR
jgi:hypothetical protein